MAKDPSFPGVPPGFTGKEATTRSIERVEDPHRIKGLLEEASDTRARSILWNDAGSKAPIFLFVESDPKAGVLRFKREAHEGDLLGWEWPETGTSFLSLFLAGLGILCFQAEIKSKTNQTLELLYPTKVFSLQRRKYLRYPIPKAYEFWAQVGAHRLRVVDLSTGGAAFAALPSQKSAYEVDRVITNITIELSPAILKADIEIRNIREMGPGLFEGQFLIGTQFRKMDEIARKELNDYLIRQWAQYPALMMDLVEVFRLTR